MHTYFTYILTFVHKYNVTTICIKISKVFFYVFKHLHIHICVYITYVYINIDVCAFIILNLHSICIYDKNKCTVEEKSQLKFCRTLSCKNDNIINRLDVTTFKCDFEFMDNGLKAVYARTNFY